MNWLRRFVSRLSGLMHARQLDRDFHEQIASHLDEAADDFVRQGLSPEDARRAALRSFGRVGRAEEEWRETRSFLSLDHLRRDLRHAVRSLRRNPGFSVVVVIVLALGTGALTSVFALLDTVVLRPLPYPASEQLVVVRHAAPGLSLEDTGLSDALYFHYADHAASLESLAVYRERVPLNLRLDGTSPERVRMTYASANLFKVLRTTPALGRLFTEEDGRPGFMSMKWQIPVLLSHEFWIQRFGADPRIVGRVLTDANNNRREVIGVLPPGFNFPLAGTEMWMLLEPSRTSSGFARNLRWDAVGRMRPGVTVVPAQAELTRLLRGIEGRDQEAAKARLAPVVTPLKSFVVGDVAQMIWLLVGGMALLLLVASANAGGLFLVRAEHRAREMAVRRALGAHGAHLARLFFLEAFVLTSVAAGLGLLLARAILAVVIALAPLELPRTAEIGLDRVAVLFALVLAALMAAFYGVLSVRRRVQPLTPGGQGGGSWATGSRSVRGSHALVAVQVALALTLMAGSALMVATYQNLSRRELGYASPNLLTVEIGLPSRKAGQHARIYHDVVERVSRLPQVERASAASFVPLTESPDLYPVHADTAPIAFKFFVPGFFQTMGTPILEGETFAPGGLPAAPSPVLVSAALARRLYPGERAVGQSIRRLNEDGSLVEVGRVVVPPFTIAGVVGDVRETTLRAGPTEIVYIPVTEPPVELSEVPTTMRLVVRAPGPLLPLVTDVKAAIAAVDSDLSVGQIETMDAIVARARSRETFVGVLLVAAAAVSLFLGAVGIYGSVAQVVRRRTREIGIRLALGASRDEVIRMVAAGSLRAILAGAALGLAVSFPATRMLGSLLFGVDAHDPAVLMLVIGALAVAAGAAALLAARQAARVTPLVALRGE
jgi:putative ABC transport system permease protein